MSAISLHVEAHRVAALEDADVEPVQVHVTVVDAVERIALDEPVGLLAGVSVLVPRLHAPGVGA